VTELPEILDRRVSELIEEVAAPTPAPAGGSVAALVVALAAGLVEMAARLSPMTWSGADAVAVRAAALRARAAPLAQADAEAYSAVLAAMRARREDDPDVRSAAVREALEAAASVPLDIAAIAAEVAQLAAKVAARGNPNLRGDAACAAALSAAAARAAANLVLINLGTADDERARRATELARAASEASREATPD
jgi:formiminotetrahydrofolate cyclodeaminase